MELQSLNAAVIAGDASRARALTEAAVAVSVPAATVVNDGLIAAMTVVGERFGRGEIYVPEMLLSARAMETCLTVLAPLFAEEGQISRGTVVLGTVKGDAHDIGKNLVGIMLKGAGFTVHDLGVNVSSERFVEAVRAYAPDIVGLSALLTTTMPAMQTVIDALVAAGIRDQLKVLVGGAPVTEEFAASIGADGYGCDAGVAVERAKDLIGASGLR